MKRIENQLAVSTLYLENVTDIECELAQLNTAGFKRLELTPFGGFLNSMGIEKFYLMAEKFDLQIVGWQGIAHNVADLHSTEWSERKRELTALTYEFKPYYMCFGAPKIRRNCSKDLSSLIHLAELIGPSRLMLEVLSANFGGSWGHCPSEIHKFSRETNNIGLLYDSFGSSLGSNSQKPDHLHASSNNLKNLSVNQHLISFLEQFRSDVEYITIEQYKTDVLTLKEIKNSLLEHFDS